MCACVVWRAEDVDRGDRSRGGRGEFSYDESDPFTTNLYVGNIHPDVSPQLDSPFCIYCGWRTHVQIHTHVKTCIFMMAFVLCCFYDSVVQQCMWPCRTQTCAHQLTTALGMCCAAG